MNAESVVKADNNINRKIKITNFTIDINKIEKIKL